MTPDEALAALKAAAVEYATHNNGVGMDYVREIVKLTNAAMVYAVVTHVQAQREAPDGEA